MSTSQEKSRKLCTHMEVHTNWIMLHFFANKHKREVGASMYIILYTVK